MPAVGINVVLDREYVEVTRFYSMFVFVVSFVCLSPDCEAALLASWSFAGLSAAGSVTPGVNGTATNFVNYGDQSGKFGAGGSPRSVSGSDFWRTGVFSNLVYNTSVGNSISFTNTSGGYNPFSFTGISFNARTLGGVVPRYINVDYAIDSGAKVNLGEVTVVSPSFPISPAVTASFGALPLLDSGSTITFFFNYRAATTTTNEQVDLDSITLNGAQVPEPLSVAVFGSLVLAGVRAGRNNRFRRMS